MRMQTNKQSIVVLLMILPYLMPDIVTRTAVGSSLVMCWKLATAAVVIWKMIDEHVVRHMPILLSLFYLTIVASGLAHGRFVVSNLTGAALLWICYYLTNTAAKRRVFYSVYLTVGKILLYGNVVTMLLFPDGLYRTSVYSLNWLLGYKNTFVESIIPILTVLCLDYFENGKRIDGSFLALWGAGVLSMALSSSATGVICIAVFSAGAWLVWNKKYPSWLTISGAFVVYFLVNHLLITGTLLELLHGLITEVLNRSATLTGRTSIWRAALSIAAESPLFGTGFVESDAFGLSFHVSHAHNMILNYRLLGGYACVAMLWLCFLYFDRLRANAAMPGLQILPVFLITIFTMGFSEALLLNSNFVYPILVIAANILYGDRKKRNRMRAMTARQIK